MPADQACWPGGTSGEVLPQGFDRLQIDVVQRLKAPVFDDNSSKAALRQLASQARRPRDWVGDHGPQTVGLTICTFAARLGVSVRTARKDGRSCLAPAKIEVAIEQTEHAILIAADATRPGSCARAVVVDHELRHARINDATVEDAATRTKTVLESLRPLLGPVYDRNLDADQAAALYVERLRIRIDRTVDAALETGRLRNAAMDTPEAYARDWQRC